MNRVFYCLLFRHVIQFIFFFISIFSLFLPGALPAREKKFLDYLVQPMTNAMFECGYSPEMFHPLYNLKIADRAVRIEKTLLEATGETSLRLAVERAEIAAFMKMKLPDTESVELERSVELSKELETAEKLLLLARLKGARGDRKGKIELLGRVLREYPSLYQAYLPSLEEASPAEISGMKKRYLKIFEELEKRGIDREARGDFYYSYFRLRTFPDVANWVSTTRYMINSASDGESLDKDEWKRVFEPIKEAIEGIPLLERSLQAEPDNPARMGLLGALYVIKTFLAIIVDSSSGTLDAGAIEKLAASEYRLPDELLAELSRGRSLLERTAKIAPECWSELYYYMALADYCASDHKAAEANLRRALALRNNDRQILNALLYLSIHAYLRGDTERLPVLGELASRFAEVGIATRDAASLFKAAKLFIITGERGKARELVEKIIKEIDNENYEARVELAYLDLVENKVRKADLVNLAKSFETMAELPSSSKGIEARINSAVVYMMAGEKKRAREIYDMLIKSYPDDPDVIKLGELIK